MSKTISLSPGSWDTFRPSFCDLQLAFTNLPVQGSPLSVPSSTIALVDCKSLAYDSVQELRFLYGCNDTPLARTGRNVRCVGEIEFGLETAQAIMQALSSLIDTETPTLSGRNVVLGGFGDVSFNLVVTYQLRPGTSVLQDVLQLCRISGASIKTQVSGRHISVKHPLSIAKISWALNGSRPSVLSGISNLGEGASTSQVPTLRGASVGIESSNANQIETE